MFQRLFVTTAFFSGKLAGAFVELRSHLGGFIGGTAEGDEDLGELGNFHGSILNRINRIYRIQIQ